MAEDTDLEVGSKALEERLDACESSDPLGHYRPVFDKIVKCKQFTEMDEFDSECIRMAINTLRNVHSGYTSPVAAFLVALDRAEIVQVQATEATFF